MNPAGRLRRGRCRVSDCLRELKDRSVDCMAMGLRALTGLLAVTILGIAGCSTPRVPTSRDFPARIAERMPATVADREGWAGDIATAFDTLGLPDNDENLCAVLAVIEQEGGYVVDPAVPKLGHIARAELEARAAAKYVPKVAVAAVLRIRASDGRPYGEWLASVRTENELSLLFEDMVGRVPLGERWLADWNPVATGGPMQVSIAFAKANARGYPYPVASTIRREVFTRRAGLYFGIAHLLDYETPYHRKIHRFADYNAGRYASRNAAFQNAVVIASGRSIALDGDVLAYGAPFDEPGETERARRAIAGDLRLGAQEIRGSLERADRLAFSESPLHQRVFELAEARAGKPLPRALLPGIRLESPKITRELTTAWFAERVDGRYRQCLAK
jgi:hypothetical protein